MEIKASILKLYVDGHNLNTNLHVGRQSTKDHNLRKITYHSSVFRKQLS